VQVAKIQRHLKILERLLLECLIEQKKTSDTSVNDTPVKDGPIDKELQKLVVRDIQYLWKFAGLCVCQSLPVAGGALEVLAKEKNWREVSADIENK
jgi:hypothetical protein